jgi:hypothetical protein
VSKTPADWGRRLKKVALVVVGLVCVVVLLAGVWYFLAVKRTVIPSEFNGLARARQWYSANGNLITFTPVRTWKEGDVRFIEIEVANRSPEKLGGLMLDFSIQNKRSGAVALKRGMMILVPVYAATDVDLVIDLREVSDNDLVREIDDCTTQLGEAASYTMQLTMAVPADIDSFDTFRELAKIRCALIAPQRTQQRPTKNPSP